MQEPSFTQIVAELEQALRQPQGHYEAVIKALDSVQKQLARNGSLTVNQVPEHARDHWYTRLGVAITQWLTAEDTRFNAAQLEAISLRKGTLVAIFQASGYRTMQHLIDLLGSKTDQNQYRFSQHKLPVLLAVLGLDYVSDTLMDIALNQPEPVLFSLMMGWLSQRTVLTAQGEKNRSRLLASGHKIENFPLQPQHISTLSHVYMYCSYAEAPHKHDIKASLNKMAVNMLQRLGVAKPKCKKYQPKKRPKMLVIHESFGSHHAMFRCYAPLIRRLKSQFDIQALANEKEIDEASDAIFDKVHRVKVDEQPFIALVQTIEKIQPDIIYYPSVGMRYYTILLSNLRLAPVQIASQGHPATTRSQAIDYVYVGGLQGEELSQLYSEKVLALGGDQHLAQAIVHEAHSQMPATLPRRTRPQEDDIHFAINSKTMKLSHRLLNICKRLHKELQGRAYFHFFPGERGVQEDALVEYIQLKVPNSKLYSPMNYPEFLQAIKNCDIALAAFPFGNTNSTVDTCVLGVPTVCHLGPEAPAQTDRNLIRKAGLPLWLVNDKDEDYFQTALSLAQDSKLRASVFSEVTPEQVYQRLLGGCESGSATEPMLKGDPTTALFKYAYDHHLDLQAEDVKQVNFRQLLEAGKFDS